ncbi:ectonucleotide pyrophosphatase/phosphodiesterase [Sphingomonas japonica]|uniref:AlkP superfamily pyrophosphatase or phosphodiesterase n=1 Tax=Sphingomonas japonica TaxID=511662 RepID=A0ABX0TXB6_9SPHN|nr:ectonucleotide pyrophosphatase/phosphodiesterase [Sphingomonas japonica]NIJ22940.1 putative AlkP superfamily pyrophosphatase or phosphodiesterase [Sphingomonas japonica]
MHWTNRLLAAVIPILLQACAAGPLATHPPTATAAMEARGPVTILIGIDGFRPDYLDRGITPVLSGLAAKGVRAAMTPSFPTKTFPNHYTLVTGLHPDRNGIVANRFEDPAHPDEVFTMASLDPYWWDQAEPIWVAAEKAGIRTATMFWPGSNAEVRGTYPSAWQQFNQKVTGAQRVDAVIDWMRRPAATRPRLVTLYFDTVDTAGHRFGPDSAEANAAIADVDALIGRLTRDLTALGQPANLVIVADHGMAAIDDSRTIALDTLVAPADVRVVEDGPYLSLHALPGREAAVAAALAESHPHVRCWDKATIPVRLAYGRNPRVPPFLCVAEEGWMILAKPPEYPVRGGAHGYDNQDPSMQALFVASGPAFASGETVTGVDSVDIEPLLRRLVGLPAAAGRDGDAAAFETLLN